MPSLNHGPVTMYYRGSTIRSTPEQIVDRWSAVVRVWNTKDVPEHAEALSFEAVFDDPMDACVSGLECGKRWIEARRSTALPGTTAGRG